MPDLPPQAWLDAVTAAVERRGGRPRAGTPEWRFCCPAHDDRHASADWNAAKGVWSCLACGAKGGTRDLAKLLEVELSTANGHVNGAARPQDTDEPLAPLPDAEQWERYRRNLLESQDPAAVTARAYLARCGIDPAACGWGLASLKPETAERLGLGRDGVGARLLLPCRDEQGRLCNARRYLGPFDGRPKMLPWAKGWGSTTLYGLDRAAGHSEWVWCEGEKDCETLAALGFAAVTHTNGTSSAARAGRLVPDGVLPRAVTVLFDADAAGREGAEKLARVLADRGCAVRVAQWPDDVPAGYDASDAVADGRAELVRQVVESASAWAGSPGRPDAAPSCRYGEHGLDDIGNAERFVALHGDRFRYCFDWKAWLVYDGRRWAMDTTDRALAAARETARSIFAEAAGAPTDKANGVAHHAMRSASRSRLEAMLALARPDLAVTSTDLDADPYLLNCPNGTVDLRTGELRPHRPGDLLHRLTRAAYQPGADTADTPGAVAWQAFLAQTAGGDAELLAYLQRAAGYSAAGDPCEEVLIFAYGPERTGKSTFLGALGYQLGDYADQVDFSAFLRRRDESELRPELAKLQGKRFVASSETSAGRSMAEGLVKTITGNEPISTCAKYRDPVTWLPAFTLWLAANDRPVVRHEDGALWRRMRVAPFVHQVPADQTDIGLKARLRDEAGEAIIAWLVAGCLAWQREGLGTCAAVQEATAAYREEMDPLHDWLEECCEVDPGKDWFGASAALFASYLQWAERVGERRPLSLKAWGEQMTRRFGERDRIRVSGRRTYGYRGLRLADEEQMEWDTDERVPPQDPHEQRTVPPVPADSGNFGASSLYRPESSELPGTGGTGGTEDSDDDDPLFDGEVL